MKASLVLNERLSNFAAGLNNSQRHFKPLEPAYRLDFLAGNHFGSPFV